MTIYEQKAMELRSVMGDNGKPKYNCAQAVVSAFAEALGYDQETACRTAALFRGRPPRPRWGRESAESYSPSPRPARSMPPLLI